VAGILACHLVFWDETGLSPIHYETKAPQKGAFFILYPRWLEYWPVISSFGTRRV
jgi:hypothetical protein